MDRRPKSEDRSQKTEVRRPKSEDKVLEFFEYVLKAENNYEEK